MRGLGHAKLAPGHGRLVREARTGGRETVAHHARPWPSVAFVLALLLCACDAGRHTATLTTADSAALRAVDQAYVEAWLADDTAAVLATLTSDAVLMPAGVGPLATPKAIRDFWWPRDGSRTRVTQYTTTIDEIAGTQDLAYMRGTGRLSFIYEKDTLRLEQTNQTMTLTVLVRAADGRWRINRRMWGQMHP
jgi:ketosteroid isomerase-like protein